MIDLRDLVVRLGSPPQAVVKRISFSVEAGGSYGLVGESGCGKSTTLNMIAGLEDISSGEIRIAGVDRDVPQADDTNKAFVLIQNR